MKRSIIIFLAGAVLGGAGGFAFGIFIYPFIFLADIVGREQVDNPASRKAVATGTFIHANPNDAIH